LKEKYEIFYEAEIYDPVIPREGVERICGSPTSSQRAAPVIPREGVERSRSSVMSKAQPSSE